MVDDADRCGSDPQNGRAPRCDLRPSTEPVVKSEYLLECDGTYASCIERAQIPRDLAVA